MIASTIAGWDGREGAAAPKSLIAEQVGITLSTALVNVVWCGVLMQLTESLLEAALDPNMTIPAKRAVAGVARQSLIAMNRAPHVQTRLRSLL